jgi:hypothetical protein
MQFVRGSLVYEGKGGGVKFSKYAVVGKGGIVVMPFLDMNCNGVFDKGEQKVVGIDLRISGGRIEKNYRDSTIHISELEPFTTYYLELQNTGFENVSWNIPKPIISITVNSNQYRIVQVPINVLGEVSGMIQHEVDGLKKGFSRMIISFYRNDSSFVAKTISEEDGYFTFLGLKPGKYYAKIDASQMRTVEMEVSPSVIPFEIQKSKEGDQVTGLEFNLRPAIHPAVGGK